MAQLSGSIDAILPNGIVLSELQQDTLESIMILQNAKLLLRLALLKAKGCCLEGLSRLLKSSTKKIRGWIDFFTTTAINAYVALDTLLAIQPASFDTTNTTNSQDQTDNIIYLPDLTKANSGHKLSEIFDIVLEELKTVVPQRSPRTSTRKGVTAPLQLTPAVFSTPDVKQLSAKVSPSDVSDINSVFAEGSSEIVVSFKATTSKSTLRRWSNRLSSTIQRKYNNDVYVYKLACNNTLHVKINPMAKGVA